MSATHDELSPERLPDEGGLEDRLRPRQLAEFVGQKRLVENLDVFIRAARERGEPVDHLLFYGPPGLGKTALAHVVAREMGAELRITSGPVIERQGDLAALLSNLETGDVLFIDEIHRLNPAVEEILYPAMEDFKMDLMVGQGPASRSIRLDVARFTLVGATTRAGLLPGRGSRAHPATLRRVAGDRPGRRGRRRDRAPLPRNAAHRQSPGAPGARLRRGGGEQ